MCHFKTEKCSVKHEDGKLHIQAAKREIKDAGDYATGGFIVLPKKADGSRMTCSMGTQTS